MSPGTKAGLVAVVIASLFAGGLIAACNRWNEAADRTIAERRQMIADYKATMIKNGCKVTQLVATAHNVYPVWSCPDGNLYKGYPT